MRPAGEIDGPPGGFEPYAIDEGLTDPALMTEARYGRHLSLSDRHTPFQDHPLAFDHFPTGSLLPPPLHAP